MAFRGRGRGRGRGGGFGSGAKELAYEVFPKIETLPVVELEKTKDFTHLIKWGNELHKFWTTSPYYLDQHPQRNGSVKRAPLSNFMKMTDEYVPAELVSKNVKHSNKKVRWDAESDLQRLDIFEKLDRESHGQDGDKKEEEDEDADNENLTEEEEESGDDDYAKNIDFDDDDDDYNQVDDGGGDEGYF